jgi:hypothetical protein
MTPVAAIRRIVASIRSDVPVANAETMDDIIDRNVVDPRQSGALLVCDPPLAKEREAYPIPRSAQRSKPGA